MEVIKNTLDHFGALRRSGEIIEETQTVIISDVSPDVLQILCARGAVSLQEKSCQDGELRLSGAVSCRVAYLSTEGKEPYFVTSSIPFAFSRPIEGMEPGDQALCAVRLLSLTSSAVNPRKLSLRAQLQVCVTLYSRRSDEYVSELRSEDGDGVYSRTAGDRISPVVAVCEKRMVVSDELRLSDGGPDEGSFILHSDVNWVTEDVRVLPGKLMLRGRADVTLSTMGRSGVYEGRSRYAVPFSQIVECDEVRPEDRVDVRCEPVWEELELKTGPDGSPVLDFSLAAATQCVIRRELALSAVRDAFSTDWSLRTETLQLALPRPEPTVVTAAVEQTAELDQAAERVEEAHAAAPCVALTKGERELRPQFELTLICRGSDGTVFTCGRRFTASCALPEPSAEDCWCEIECGEPSAALNGEGEVSVRFEVRLRCFGIAGETVPLLSSCALDRSSPREHTGRPSLLVRPVDGRQTVWELARDCVTSPQLVAAANKTGIEDRLPEGSLVLIPFRNR
ncbi:MAG: DUF3794 domain-containing protein [Ruminococcaceae bacterium]|nr:DUF3794 domain-containing protein [Oscillospiraceae bacterium]